MQSPPLPLIKSFTPPSSAPNLPLATTTTMSYNAPTPSSPSSLTSSIVDVTSRPSSTRPEAGWGSPPPAPDSFPPVSLATVLTPIHSVTIPLYAHTLRDDSPTPRTLRNSQNTFAPPPLLSPLIPSSTSALRCTPFDVLISRTHTSDLCLPISLLPHNRLSSPASYEKFILRSKDHW